MVKLSKRVLTSGVFDGVDQGHIYFLKEAKKLGGENAELVVVLARGNTVKKFKGRLPRLSEQQRKAGLLSLKFVDKVTFGYKKFDIEKIIGKIKPDIVAIGFDQKNIQKMVEAVIKRKKLKIRVVRIGKYGPEGI